MTTLTDDSSISKPQNARTGTGVRGSIASLTSLVGGVSNSWLNLTELAFSDAKVEELRSVEQKYLATARELYKSEKVDCLSTHELLQFLKSQKHHAGKALGALSDHLGWRESFKVHTILSEDFSELDQTGAAQFVGHTRTGVPILILNNSRHRTPKDAASRDRMIRYAIHLIERARSEGILTDKLVILLDRFNTTSSQMDTWTLKTLIPIFQKNYPEMLQRLIIFPNTTLFWMAWKMIKGAVDSSTLKKIEIRDNPETLIGIIDRDQLFERYGGLVKDMYDEIPVTHEHEHEHPHHENADPLELCPNDKESSEAASSPFEIAMASSPDSVVSETTPTHPIPPAAAETPAKMTDATALDSVHLPVANEGVSFESGQAEQPPTLAPSSDATNVSLRPSASAPEQPSALPPVSPQPQQKKGFKMPAFSWKSAFSSSATATTAPTATTTQAEATEHNNLAPHAGTENRNSSTTATPVSPTPHLVQHKSAALAVPPLCPLTVEVLWSAPVEFEEAGWGLQKAAV
ncbi:hypothetical protein HDU98_001238 [Podochytrium sp. JEL0797]|nr:hypothetical protein HDU98_001238 [Podochytrium sp. JEL0797]